ncbi:MAG: hypothetical protein FJ206_02440 [Gemmatimonadetes bacterium]|nr:hypothetical protein [Gemmatimonadota bacterium]
MRAPALAVLIIVAGSPAQAQSESDTPKTEPERLFRSRAPIEFVLRADFDELFKDRDTIKVKELPGTIAITDERKGAVELPVTLETRGHFRLRRNTCSFAPLKVKFDKAAAKGTVFNDQGSLKLVTHCQGGSRYEQNLLVEESIYRMYNVLTPLSHRTRLSRIKYVPAKDTTKAVTRYAFFIEDDDDMAKRNGGKVLMQTGAAFSDMEPSQMDLVATFQYLIGNTDWSVFAIHNIRIIDVGPAAGGFFFPVAYDFDFSGLVGAAYAVPDERLPIKSVKARLYRGPCRRLEELQPTVDLFRGKADSLYAVFKASEVLEPGRQKQAVEYLDGFFETIRRPKGMNDAMGYACRG